MPPRKRVNTAAIATPPAAGRELRKTSIPLKQAKFPSPNKRVRRTYGTKAPKHIPKLQKQDTLTQIWPRGWDGAEIDGEEEEEGEEGLVEDDKAVDGGLVILEEQETRRRSAKRMSGNIYGEGEDEEDDEDEGYMEKRKRRRRTAGDELEFMCKGEPKKSKKGRRKTLGDTPLSVSQQTLTQMVMSPMPSYGDGEGDDPIVDDLVYEVPNSSQYQPPFPRRRPATPKIVSKEQEKRDVDAYMPPPPQTPHRRPFRQEIPSSQSPVTPCSIHSRSGRTPLLEKSLNTPIPFCTNVKSTPTQLPSNTPRLVVRDTFDTEESQATRINSTPPKKSSPAKIVRFNLPDEITEDSDEEATQNEDDTSPILFPGLIRKAIPTEILDDIQEDWNRGTQIEPSFSIRDSNSTDLDDAEDANSPTQISERTSKFKDKLEILDSDEEGDFDSESESESETENDINISSTAGPSKEDLVVEDLCEVPVDNPEDDSLVSEVQNGEVLDDVSPDTCYGGTFGMETQFEAEQIVSSVESSKQTEVQVNSIAVPLDVVKPSRSSDGPLETSYHPEETQVPEGRSQFVSQRLSTQHVDDMEPRTADSDAFISIHPSQVKLIKNRTKGHIVKKWPLPSKTVRVWLYETDPKSRVKYMTTIGPAKHPRNSLDEQSEDNTAFNSKQSGTADYAYEIFDLYELSDPVSLNDIKEKGWFKAAPSKFIHVRPVPLDDLMANLLPPIFTRYDAEAESEVESEEEPENAPEYDPIVSSSNDTQEAEAQLVATIQQFTQPLAEVNSDPPVPETPDREDIDSEIQLPSIQTQTPQFLRPSQAETVDLTQLPGETPIHQSLPEIVWESPTRPVLSSTPQLPTPRVLESPTRRVPSSTPRFSRAKVPEYESSEYGDADRVSDSVVPFSISSSQFLTKSQMLPDSLINNSIPGPTMFVGDSDEEDEIEEIEEVEEVEVEDGEEEEDDDDDDEL